MRPESIIYLSEQRGCTQSSTHRSFHSFNFGSYQNIRRKPFQNLVAFNDDTILEGACISYSIPGSHLIFLLPVIGGMEHEIDSEEKSHFLDVGQCVSIYIRNPCVLTIKNTYHTESINFICCWFADVPSVDNLTYDTCSFNLGNSVNSLESLLTTCSLRIYLGKFMGRADFNLRLQTNKRCLFAFVVEGAFEFQNRLLRQKDGLSISDVSEVDFEALSREAIVLIFEL